METPVPAGSKPPKDVWNDALKYLKKTDPGIFGPLSQGKYGGYQDGTYKALFGPGTEIFVTMLSAPERRAKVEAALKQCGGGDCKFDPQGEQQAPKEAAPQDEKNLAGLIDMFGRDKVQIDE